MFKTPEAGSGGKFINCYLKKVTLNFPFLRYECLIRYLIPYFVRAPISYQGEDNEGERCVNY